MPSGKLFAVSCMGGAVIFIVALLIVSAAA